MVAATPYYYATGKYVVGGSDREYASDGMWAFVSGTFTYLRHLVLEVT